MNMYNAIFGKNAAAPLFLAMLGKGEQDFGRFRDCYLVEEGGEPLVAVYTRNGGGNREHYAYDTHSQFNRDTRSYTHYCKWSYAEERWESITPDCPFGKDPDIGLYDAHTPVYRKGPECDCTGCTITYRIPRLDGYVRDADDDFDSTYCTVYMRPPAEYREILAGYVQEGGPGRDWDDLLAALNDPPADPETRGAKIAVNLLASLKPAQDVRGD